MQRVGPIFNTSTQVVQPTEAMSGRSVFNNFSSSLFVTATGRVFIVCQCCDITMSG